MENSKSITVQKLNQAYIKLIKMVLNGTYTTTTPHINSFYHDPSPDEAYSILNRIFYEQSPIKKQPLTTDSNQGSVKKLQIRRAMTSDQKQSSRKAYQQINDLNIQIKKDTIMQKSGKKKVVEIGTTKKQKGNDQQSKAQRLQRITGKITEIFENNQKKVTKFEQIKKSNGDNEYRYAKVNQILFKKY